MAVRRMDNVGIVVEDLGATIDFFLELGLELEGRATIEDRGPPFAVSRQMPTGRGRSPPGDPWGPG